MPSCAVISCRVRSQQTSIAQAGISFHRFPKDPDMKVQWIKRTGREFWYPTKTSTICSRHFTDEDFITKTSGNRFLRLGAIPSKKIVKVKSNVTSSLSLAACRALCNTKGGSLVPGHRFLGNTSRKMTKCAIIHCKNYSNRTKNVSFHPFPNDPSRREQWVKAVRRNTFWIPSKHDKICSKHFEPECYSEHSKLRKLKKDAVPTLDLPGSMPSNTETVTRCLNCMCTTEVKTERLEEPGSPQSWTGDSDVVSAKENGKVDAVAIDPLSPRNSPVQVSREQKSSSHKNKKANDIILRKKLLKREEACKTHVQKIYSLLKANRRLCQQNKNFKKTLMNMKKKIAVLAKKRGMKSEEQESSSTEKEDDEEQEESS